MSGRRHVPIASPPGKNTSAHLLGGWVGHRAVLGILEKRKIPFACRHSNPECPGHSLGAKLIVISPFLTTIPQKFDVLLTVHLSIFILVINQLDAQNLFYNKYISCLYMFRAPCAHRQEVKLLLYSLCYHHTETSEWSKITKIILVILVILVILDHSLVSVWWYQRLYNTILTSWRWAHGARNI